jgi:hypothetical protein
MDQTQDAVDIFKHLHPNKVGVWLFDCSSAHEGLAADALNVNNMNFNPGGKQKHLHSTVIPLNNPAPKLGQLYMHSMVQDMVYPQDHPTPELYGQPKGMKAVFQEQVSVWDELPERCGGKVVGKCKEWAQSQTKNVPNDMLWLQKQWDKKIHWRKLISCKQMNQIHQKGMLGAVCTKFSHCKRISQMRNQCCNTTLKGEVVYVCSCPNSIVSSM